MSEAPGPGEPHSEAAPNTDPQDPTEYLAELSEESTSGFDTDIYSGSISEDKTSLGYERIQNGRQKQILAMVDGDGCCEALEFLDQLDAKSWAQFKARFERYCDQGYLRSPNEMRVIIENNVSVPVYEIKTHSGYRLFGVLIPKGFMASHGDKKPKPRAVGKHARKARDRFNEWMERRGGPEI
ncbi:hypothetical protein [Mycobacteroides chelonae]|uniref:hypothetical protein n=1 Tax=Mycobacteroides chelonae TaxID=1774 RepID=UPI003AAEE0A6